MNHHCPHNNTCSPSSPCSVCAGAHIVKDGDRVHVPMIFQDGDPRKAAADVHARAVADNARAGQAALDAAKRAGKGLQSAVDHALQEQAKRDHHLTRNGYNLSMQGFDRVGPSGG